MSMLFLLVFFLFFFLCFPEQSTAIFLFCHLKETPRFISLSLSYKLFFQFFYFFLQMDKDQTTAIKNLFVYPYQENFAKSKLKTCT